MRGPEEEAAPRSARGALLLALTPPVCMNRTRTLMRACSPHCPAHTQHTPTLPTLPCSANEKLMLERLVIKKGAFLDVSGGEVRACKLAGWPRAAHGLCTGCVGVLCFGALCWEELQDRLLSAQTDRPTAPSHTQHLLIACLPAPRCQHARPPRAPPASRRMS